ncbi:hypothetical protein EV122DRAFT_179525, partial [Schizophyllum commune]
QITFTSSVDSDDTATIQSEQDEFFSFAPESAWAQVHGSDYNGGSEHLTVQSDTSISLSFAGDRVALYGTYGSDYAIYSAQLDDGPTSIMNASRPTEPLSQQLLFQATGLEKGVAHNLTLNSLSQGGAKFAVDYAEVDGASNAAMGKAANTTGTGGEAAATASESAGKTGSETRTEEVQAKSGLGGGNRSGRDSGRDGPPRSGVAPPEALSETNERAAGHAVHHPARNHSLLHRNRDLEALRLGGGKVDFAVVEVTAVDAV